jgi:hypothetical protein
MTVGVMASSQNPWAVNLIQFAAVQRRNQAPVVVRSYCYLHIFKCKFMVVAKELLAMDCTNKCSL